MREAEAIIRGFMRWRGGPREIKAPWKREPRPAWRGSSCIPGSLGGPSDPGQRSSALAINEASEPLMRSMRLRIASPSQTIASKGGVSRPKCATTECRAGLGCLNGRTDQLRFTNRGWLHARRGQARREEWSWSDYRTGETFHTNSIEGFCKLFKNSVRSTHIHISGEKMPKYLAEFCSTPPPPAERRTPVIGPTEALLQGLKPLSAILGTHTDRTCASGLRAGLASYSLAQSLWILALGPLRSLLGYEPGGSNCLGNGDSTIDDQLSPLAGNHHVDGAAAAPRAHQPLAPSQDRDAGGVPMSQLGRCGLDLVAAGSARYDQAEMGVSGSAESLRRSMPSLQ
jgi:hypothetical protein